MGRNEGAAALHSHMSQMEDPSLFCFLVTRMGVRSHTCISNTNTIYYYYYVYICRRCQSKSLIEVEEEEWEWLPRSLTSPRGIQATYADPTHRQADDSHYPPTYIYV